MSEADNRSAGTLSLFYSYSHEDEEHRQQLEKHLAALRHQNVISEWHDRKISPGEEWNPAIEKALRESRIILCLLSSDFLASGYCWHREMQLALERHDKGEARVVPVILRPVYWEDTPIMKLQALPQDARAVVLWDHPDEAFANIARGIRRIADELMTPSLEGMAEIPAGEFTMGTPVDDVDRLVEWASRIYVTQTPERRWFLDETPRHRVEVSQFWLDESPVTNGQYWEFTEKTGYPTPLGFKEVAGQWEYDFKPWDSDTFKNPDQPVVCVNWYDALAYARWKGKRLPTEAEWEKAARGTWESHAFPWGNEEPDEEKCNFGDKIGHPTPQDSARTHGGLCDMAGNVWEWCLDEYRENFYQDSPRSDPCAGFVPNVGQAMDFKECLRLLRHPRVIRGGCWQGEAGGCRVARRNWFLPANSNHTLGFRCAYSQHTPPAQEATSQ